MDRLRLVRLRLIMAPASLARAIPSRENLAKASPTQAIRTDRCMATVCLEKRKTKKATGENSQK